jgi:F420H(2)-dependent quinone reductase
MTASYVRRQGCHVLDEDSVPISELRPSERFWRNRRLARLRHRLLWLRRSSPFLTRAHARLIRWTGGRIRRSFIFTGGMPLLVLTTVGRKSGKHRSTPLGYLPFGNGFAVIASNAGSDRVPAWWLNLQAHPDAEVLADRTRHAVRGRVATASEDDTVWAEFARLNPGFDEYRNLTQRRIPVVVLERNPSG